MTELVVPQLNNTDDSVVVAALHVADGEYVAVGTPVADVETSKATHELVAPADGPIRFTAKAGEEVAVGDVLAVVGGNLLTATDPAPTLAGGTFTLTNSARAVVNAHGLTDEQLGSLGKRVLRTADLEPLLTPASGRWVELSRRQQTVAKVVSRSSNEIPAAFCVIDVSLDAFDAVVGGGEHGGMIGFPEVVVKAVGHTFDDFPTFFASLTSSTRLELPEAPRVGFTVDAGNGLVIPGIDDPRGRGVDAIADAMMELRLNVLDGSLREEDLGGHVVVSVNHDDGVVFVQPLVFPGNVAIVSIGGRMEGGAGPHVHVGIAYDHRVINGRDAVTFGQALRTMLESEETLAGWRIS